VCPTREESIAIEIKVMEIDRKTEERNKNIDTELERDNKDSR